MKYDQKGLTLLEVLIVSGIVIIAGGVTVAVQRDLLSVNNLLTQSFSNELAAELAVKTITAELRASSISAIGAYPLEQTKAFSIVFYSNADNDGTKERVTYFLDGKNLKKSTIKPAGTPLTYATTTAQETITIVLRDVVASTTAPLFTYYNGTYSGNGASLALPVDPSVVRLIGVRFEIDANPNAQPPPVIASTQVTVRNLKDNL